MKQLLGVLTERATPLQRLIYIYIVDSNPESNMQRLTFKQVKWGKGQNNFCYLEIIGNAKHLTTFVKPQTFREF